MAVFKPFKAVRPKHNVADRVISLPYDVMNREEAYAMAEGNPLSFLRVTRAEIDLPSVVGDYDEAVYNRAKENLDEFIRGEYFYKEDIPVFMIYKLTFAGNEQTGFVGCVSVDEYENGVVRRHELTRVEKEDDRSRHFDICGANTEPVFLTYRSNEVLAHIIDEWVLTHDADYSFKTAEGVGHTVWTVNDQSAINKIRESFEAIERLYIADGHHRSASAYKTGLSRRMKNPGYTGDEEYNFFMAVAFPHTEIRVFDYNRLIKDLAGKSKEEFIADISSCFNVKRVFSAGYNPEEEHEIGLYLGDFWYKLIAKKEIIPVNDIIGALDVNLLQNNILGPILGINDPRVDERLEFVGGIRGSAELERRVHTDMAAAFALYPVSVSILLDAADKNMIMPPKSTWFEPKLGSGLFIHEI